MMQRGAPVDLADDGDDGVAGQAVVGPREQPVLEVRLVVEEQAQPVANEQLALRLDPFSRLLRAAEAGGIGATPQLVAQLGGRVDRSAHDQAGSAAIFSRNVLANVITVSSRWLHTA